MGAQLRCDAQPSAFTRAAVSVSAAGLGGWMRCCRSGVWNGAVAYAILNRGGAINYRCRYLRGDAGTRIIESRVQRAANSDGLLEHFASGGFKRLDIGFVSPFLRRRSTSLCQRSIANCPPRRVGSAIRPSSRNTELRLEEDFSQRAASHRGPIPEL